MSEQFYPEHFIEFPEGKIHYIDEGNGDPIVFSHGTPEWSYAYRHLINDLKTSFRCVAPDHFGFGKSDKPKNGDFTVEAQAKRFERFIDQLKLKNIILVANDFGVGIALNYALRHPENVKAIVLSNGWAWSLSNSPHFSRPAKLLQGWFGELVYLQLNFAVRWMMPAGYGDRAKLTKEIHRQYLAPFHKKKDRMATLVYAREILNAGNWWQNLWNQLEILNKKPFLIIWGVKDKFITPTELAKWKSKLKHAQVCELLDCGHFVHEEEPEKMVDEVRIFLKSD